MPEFSKDITKHLDNLKIFGNRTKQRLLVKIFFKPDRKRFVLIQNFDLETLTFDLFWNESSTTEASVLDRSLI